MAQASPRRAATRFENTGPHDHVCFPYESRDQHFAAAIPFLRRGLALHERCVYITPELSSSAILNAFEAGGVPARDAERTGALSVVQSEQVWGKRDHLDPAAVLASVRAWEDVARRNGFSSLRLVGDMMWMFRAGADSDELLEYEARLDAVIADHSVSAMCLFDRERFRAETIREAIVVHPSVAVGDRVCANNEYLRLGDFLASDRASREVTAVLRGLESIERLRESVERYRALAVSLLETREKERRALARDLHDDVGQLLASIHLGIEAFRGSRPEPDQEALCDVNTLVVEAMECLRNLALDLRPSLLDDIGLAAALRSYVRRHSVRAPVEACLDVSGLAAPLSPALATTCFRLVQGAFANVIRHAGARRVEVSVRTKAGAVQIVVHDDGRGFDVKAARERALGGHGLGLLCMEERASLAGGRLRIKSAPGKGTTVLARLPVDDGADP